jgi:hypothetical protein
MPKDLAFPAVAELLGWVLVTVAGEPLGVALIAAAESYFLAQVILYNWRDLSPDERASWEEVAALGALAALYVAGAGMFLWNWIGGLASVLTALGLMVAWMMVGDEADFRFPPTPFF